MKNIKQAIEAILFVAGSPVSTSELAKILKVSEEEIKNAVRELISDYERSGIVITEAQNSYQMATAAEVSSHIKNYLQAELREKLTETAVETLSIIAYKQPVARSEIEAIRGVNCQYILRLLAQRGLIEKTPKETDARIFLYSVTHEFLHHLGIKSVKELPDFEQITKNLNPPSGFVE